eukprot:314213-Rhodomonas_salina.1
MGERRGRGTQQREDSRLCLYQRHAEVAAMPPVELRDKRARFIPGRPGRRPPPGTGRPRARRRASPGPRSARASRVVVRRERHHRDARLHSMSACSCSLSPDL